MGLFEDLREFGKVTNSADFETTHHEDDFYDSDFEEEEPDLGEVSGLSTVLD